MILAIRLHAPRLATLALAVTLGACNLVGASAPASSGAAARPLLVATTRAPASDPGAAPFFGAERGGGLAFAQATLAPPSSTLFASLSPFDADWSVVGVGPVVTSEPAEAFARAAVGRDVLLYVHGYRETFETAAAGAAGLADGIGFRGATGLFTWPSSGATLDYGYDRESALWSRDALETLLLTPRPQRERRTRAHRGAFHGLPPHAGDPALRARERRRRGHGPHPARWCSPRRTSISTCSRRVSSAWAWMRARSPSSPRRTIAPLALSSRLAGGVVRAGAADRARLDRLGVTVADASEFGGRGLNHDLFLRDPDVRAVVERAR